MDQHPGGQKLPRAQILADRAFSALDHFLHVESASGIVLLIATVAALLWANSPAVDSYHALLHLPLSFSIGSHTFSNPLHFWINDGLMTVFFLVVGMEIRREIHDGALSSLKIATLPLAAALGGVMAPALIYLALTGEPGQRQGWAVPTATDIAFAVGILALLGRAVPGSVRVLLLALAIIDDVVAVLIIAFFYSGGLDYSGLLVAGAGILMVLGLQQIGVGSAFAYIAPGVVLWVGLLQTGIHPTLAGVMLGLMTPALPMRTRDRPLDVAARALKDILARTAEPASDLHALMDPIKRLGRAQRELVSPVNRMQMALHPWVAYGVMPIFALANAGVTFEGINLDADGATGVMLAVVVALAFGKPLGVVAASWFVVRLGWCRLPRGVTWANVLLIGLLAGIGFTMSIFIAMLAFDDENLLGAAKLGVLLGSLASAILGLAWGWLHTARHRS